MQFLKSNKCTFCKNGIVYVDFIYSEAYYCDCKYGRKARKRGVLK